MKRGLWSRKRKSLNESFKYYVTVFKGSPVLIRKQILLKASKTSIRSVAKLWPSPFPFFDDVVYKRPQTKCTKRERNSLYRVWNNRNKLILNLVVNFFPDLSCFCCSSYNLPIYLKEFRFLFSFLFMYFSSVYMFKLLFISPLTTYIYILSTTAAFLFICCCFKSTFLFFWLSFF